MLHRVLGFGICVLLLSSCGFTRNRAGYFPLEEQNALDCVVKIATMANVDSLEKLEVGRLRLGEAPFLEYPWMCNKEDALKVIRAEACNTHATFANIIYEDYPTFMQSCYHCVVVFYRLPPSEDKALKEAIAKSQAKEPEPDPNFTLVVLGKLLKIMALAGAAFGIANLLKRTEI